MERTPEDVVAEHHRDLHSRLFEIESKFDNASLLVAGGAFSVSAAFVPRLEQGGAHAWTLLVAWIAWSLCIALSLWGHLLSARCHKRRIVLIDKGNYHPKDWDDDFWDLCLPKVNVVTFALLVAGFVFFGVYTFANLKAGGEDGEGKEESRQEIQGRPNPQGEQRPDASAGVPQAPTQEQQVVTSDERQTQANAPAAGTTSDRAEGRLLPQQRAEAGQGDERPPPAAGVSEDARP